MEQQQIKVSFSLGTKLLFSVVSLLVIVIAFLNASTIVLLTKDKRAYTFQSQSTEAVLVGREFVNLVQGAIDTLRLSLASINPSQPVTAQQVNALQSVLRNQTSVMAVDLQLVDVNTGELTALAHSASEASLEQVGFKPEELALPVDLTGARINELLEKGYSLVHLNQVGKSPLLAVVLADVNLKNHPQGLPISIGWVSLRGMGSEVKGSRVTVADRGGWVLFDSDPAALLTQTQILGDPLFQAAVKNPLANGAQEYDHDGTKLLGSYVKPGLDLVVLTRTEWRKAMRATYAMTEKFVLLGLMAVGAAVIFAILFAKRLTAPIQNLYTATREVASGNFEVNLEAKSRDEIGALTGSFVAMSRKINDLIQESMQKVVLENELAIASTVQQTLIPPPKFRNDFIDISSHYQAASQCGGDWWGFFGVDRKICVMIADATGHGLPSALITASARSCFSVMHKLAQEDPEFSFSPGAMLAYANRVVHDAASGQIMMTFFTGVIDFEAGTLTYASAGHNPPWLFTKENGKYALKSLTAIGQRLGESRDVPIYEEKTVSIQPSDVLFLYTDGIMEGKSLNGEMYGKKRVRKLVEGQIDKGPDQVLKTLVGDFLQHNDGKSLDDDITLAVARITQLGARATV